MAKSKTKCEQTNDYKEAIYRYENARSNWKEHWWECICNIYEKCEEFAKEYVLDRVHKIITKVTEIIKKTRVSKYDKMIDNNNYDITTKKGELCYLFEFYDKYDNFICSKVGTTTRTIKQRLIEELRSKTYKEMGAEKAIVNRVYECGNLPSEGLESLIRAEYIRKFPKAFKKNDRFIGEKFDFDFCDKIAKNYLELA